MTHWCHDIPRDEAVRASEDGRSGPLPTLEEVISGVTERRPPEPGGSGNVTGLRTERVTLEVTHDLDAPLGEWIVQVIDESLGYDETVRVVEEAHFDDLAQVSMERDAAIRERDRLRHLLNTKEDECRSHHPWVHPTGAPAASGAAGAGWLTGWLTGDERLAVSGAIVILDQHGTTNIGRSLNALLARSSPPEVVLPRDCGGESYDSFVAGWNNYRDEALKALAAAGVTVKEVGE